jgi:hypothetical protein
VQASGFSMSFLIGLSEGCPQCGQAGCSTLILAPSVADEFHSRGITLLHSNGFVTQRKSGGQGQLPSGQTAKVRPDYRVQSLHEGHGRQGSIQLKNDGNNSQDHRLSSSAQINRLAVFVIAVDIPSHDARHARKDRLLPITFLNRVGEAADQRRRPKNRQTKKDMHASPELE